MRCTVASGDEIVLVFRALDQAGAGVVAGFEPVPKSVRDQCGKRVRVSTANAGAVLPIIVVTDGRGVPHRVVGGQNIAQIVIGVRRVQPTIVAGQPMPACGDVASRHVASSETAVVVSGHARHRARACAGQRATVIGVFGLRHEIPSAIKGLHQSG